ncbi:MAG: hypothetical protein AB7F35_05120 [Acetobacteraceae bacterium]
MAIRGGSDDGTGAGRPTRRYANHLAIDVTLSSVELRFGQRAAAGEPEIHSRLVASPIDLVAFGHAIQASIARYERQFGPIPDGSEPGPGETRQ